MSIVAQGANWWIESFTVTRASILSNSERETTHTLERPGVFLGGSATMDHDIAANSVTGLNLVLRNTDNSQLVIGSNITAVESVFMNDGASARIVGEIVLIFLRKP